MKINIIITILVSFFIIQQAQALTGREIIEKSDSLPEPETVRSLLLMKIHKGSLVTEKEFELRMKQYGKDEFKALISFIRPTNLKLLTHSYEDQEDSQWLRLSSGKVKRIANSDKGKPFVNSHFYYEDLSSIKIEDYRYQLLGEENAVGVDCYKVEAVPLKKDTVYDKLILYPRKTDCFIVRVDYFRNGSFHKFLENHDIRVVNNIVTPGRVVMSLPDQTTGTSLYLKRLKYNSNIKDASFNKEAIR